MRAIDTFCRQVRSRSRENAQAIRLLHGAELYGNVISVLRQELDSMVRVIYLLSITDRDRRARLIEDAAAGRIWKSPSAGRITDREMVALADRLHGWARSVYRFGCAFIHLSSLHDYRARDPVQALDPRERHDLVHHLRHYHGGPQSDNPTFEQIAPYLPRAFEKVASNLECYLKNLENGDDLES